MDLSREVRLPAAAYRPSKILGQVGCDKSIGVFVFQDG